MSTPPTSAPRAASDAHAPTIRALTQHECLALLARNHVGRLAFSFHNQVDIQPVNYVYDAGWIFGRTSEGAKLVTLAHSHWVAFEVDEVRGTFDWESVVVRGSFHRIDPEGTPDDRSTYAHALQLVRTIVPDSFTPQDPVPQRTVLFRIALGDVTGRKADPGRGAP